ncbi:DUF692 domain-containing protein [Sphingomonas sp. G124]|uniref:DUF692 domain-containing protein n=1 Tax=Sphingomonas cremea TaxID=2904799 RepID=A0A9X1TZ26_9SPHN|nr:DUF692 domain-containing protein [Sphingomonas cremea]MCF2515422.1 DUF692 domain-containing protein [Sphingomonas cremea]
MTPTAGLGFKPVHYEQALACPAAGLWFEIHAENYMVDGGPRLAMLEALRASFPLSVHGVGLSLAGTARPDGEHLSKLKRLVDRFQPFLLSEHLAWSRHEEVSFPDLLPFPRTNEALETIGRNIDITQSALGRQILIENPSLYMQLEGHEWPESLFLAELVRRTGCGLLIDVNNVFVSANNLGFNPVSYLDALPRAEISEIHLAGHSEDPLLGGSLLIDSHDTPVSAEVWKLYDWLLAHRGTDRPPTLIERDDNIPEFDTLLIERDKAAAMMAGQREVANA